MTFEVSLYYVFMTIALAGVISFMLLSMNNKLTYYEHYRMQILGDSIVHMNAIQNEIKRLSIDGVTKAIPDFKSSIMYDLHKNRISGERIYKILLQDYSNFHTTNTFIPYIEFEPEFSLSTFDIDVAYKFIHDIYKSLSNIERQKLLIQLSVESATPIFKIKRLSTLS